jgi:hypothetical protein
MVQNKKNFSSGKKLSEDTQDLDRKSHVRNADRAADSRTANTKQTGISKDKAGISKRDMGSRK